jgi:hypothetical protein
MTEWFFLYSISLTSAILHVHGAFRNEVGSENISRLDNKGTAVQALKTYPVFNYTQQHEDVWGNGSVAPRILNLGARWKRVVSFTPRPLYPQGEFPVSIGQEAGWASEPVWTQWPYWESTPCRPSSSLVTTLTELPRLLTFRICFNVNMVAVPE